MIGEFGVGTYSGHFVADSAAVVPECVVRH